METQIILIDRDELLEILTSAYIRAEGFEWTGWRLPVYTSQTGELSVGGWLSNSSWQPDCIELPVRVEKWHLPEDADIEFEAKEIAEFEIRRFAERIFYGESWGAYQFRLGYKE